MRTQLQDCYVKVINHQVQIGNSFIERTFNVSTGRITPTTLTNKFNSDQWVQPSLSMHELPGISTVILPEKITISSNEDDDYATAAPHLKVILALHYPIHRHVIHLECKIYPHCSFIQHEWFVTKTDLFGDGHHVIWIQEDARSIQNQSLEMKMNLDENNIQNSKIPNDYLDFFDLLDIHCRWSNVILRDVTDTNNNIVSVDDGMLYQNESSGTRGNLLILSKTLKNSGMIILKEGPTPLAHLNDPGEDFRFYGKKLFIRGSGLSMLDVNDLNAEQSISAYGSMIGVYDGELYKGYQLLHQYQQNIHRYQPERDYFIMSNTWGDRSMDGRINEAFLLTEMAAAKEIGVTHVQIDCGWQHGITINSLNEGDEGRWSDYYADGDQFWAPHPERLPHGLTPLKLFAELNSVHLGLWFSPDSAYQFSNWEKDADKLIDFHHEYGICHYKLDGIDLTTKQSESNLVCLMQKVIMNTNSSVHFNLDTTNQIRLGYYRKTQYGSLFLENRYTDWCNYYPHWTFRNLWKLAPYVPAQKLQIEFLNVERNQALYKDDPLSPSACGIMYSFITSLFSNPLAWMELSSLQPVDRKALKDIIAAIKEYHPLILSGHILPIGLEPTGTGWTGMQSISNDHEGFLLICRELSPLAAYTFKLWGIEKPIHLLRIAATDHTNSIHVQGNIPDANITSFPDSSGRFSFNLSNTFTFSIYKYTVIHE